MKIISRMLALICLFAPFASKAQSYIPDYHDHHLYFHVEMSSGNIFPLAAWSILSGVLNSALDYNMMESGFAYDLYTGQGVKTRYHSPAGFMATELFNHIQPGIKIGYYSDYLTSSVNWGLLATAGYKINQFDMAVNDSYVRQNVQRAQLGGMLILAFGQNGGGTQALFEAGLRYNIATKYKGGAITDTKALNNGLSSHFALKFGGGSWVENVGVFADFDHYNLYNSGYTTDGVKPFQSNKLKNFTIGVCVTLTPDQVESWR